MVFSISKGDVQCARGHHHVAVHGNKFELCGRLLERNVVDPRRVDGDHHAILPFCQCAHCGRTEDQSKRPVNRSRLAPAQQMAEHHGARFLTRQFLQLTGHDFADATEPLDVIALRGFFQRDAAANGLRTFGDDHDGVLPVCGSPPCV